MLNVGTMKVENAVNLEARIIYAGEAEITEAIVANAIQLINEGVSDVDVMERAGVPYGLVGTLRNNEKRGIYRQRKRTVTHDGGRKWTEEEVNALVRAYEAGDLYWMIAEKLNRTVTAVAARCGKMHASGELELRIHNRSNGPWTDADTKQALMLRNEGRSDYVICKIMHRGKAMVTRNLEGARD